MTPEIILGPPGTGKTTALLEEVEDALESGTPSDKIGFLSFTRQAVNVAKERAVTKFGLKAEDLPYFRTLHALAFWQLGLSKNLVLKRDQYKEIGDALGLDLSGTAESVDGTYLCKNKDDVYPSTEQFSRVSMTTLEDAYEKIDDDHLDLAKLVQFRSYLIKYKAATQYLDFTDMLTRFIRDCEPPELDLLLIDESQDLSALQWEVVKFLSKGAKRLIIAGDDDQAIYEWSGADVDQFINLEGSVRVLQQSHRLPSSIHEVALNCLDQMGSRREKLFHPRESVGCVHYMDFIEDIDLTSGNWLILARDNFLVSRVKSMLEDRRMLYLCKEGTPIKKKSTFLEDKIYLKACLDAGEDIDKPRIEVSTIHGAKGRECDNVILLTDMSRRVWKHMQQNPDEENRVLYVGLTRARNELYLIAPKTRYHFEV